jgi:endonuclease/exonuclease/phosphatase family metal-dependent hydrolase
MNPGYLLLIFLFMMLDCFLLPVSGNQYEQDSTTMEDSFTHDGAKLKILSWNIGLLPYIDFFSEGLNRAAYIAHELSSTEYDVVVFQEVFSARARKILKKSLQEKYPFIYGPFNRSGMTVKFSSGLFILSKIPLRVIREIEFSEASGFDCFARKGAVLLEGKIHQTKFHLIATHLQDDVYPQSIREKQLAEIHSALILPHSDPDIPQLICGDFNTNARQTENYQGMLTLLDAQDGSLSGPMQVTFDDESNDISNASNRNPRLIDYILARNTRLISHISRRVTVVKAKWAKNRHYLSDHHGVEALVVFRELQYLTSENPVIQN